MAIVIWTDGGNDGDWSDTSNWSTGSVPVSNDDVIIPLGSNNIIAGLNQAAVALDTLQVTAPINIGNTGSSLQIDVDEEMIIAGRGEMYKFDGNFGVVTNQIPGAGTLYLDSGTTTTLVQISGNCEATNTGIVTTAIVSGGRLRSYDAATGFTSLVVNGGRVLDERGGTTANVATGRLTALLDSPWTTINVYNSGELDLQTTGTLATVNVYSGSNVIIGNAIRNPVITTLNAYGPSKIQKSAFGITLAPSASNEYGTDQ